MKAEEAKRNNKPHYAKCYFYEIWLKLSFDIYVFCVIFFHFAQNIKE